MVPLGFPNTLFSICCIRHGSYLPRLLFCILPYSACVQGLRGRAMQGHHVGRWRPARPLWKLRFCLMLAAKGPRGGVAYGRQLGSWAQHPWSTTHASRRVRMPYRDRAAERRKGVNPDYERVSADLSGIATDAAALGDGLNMISVEDSKFLGGDLEHTHLVKGLDYALLQKARSLRITVQFPNCAASLRCAAVAPSYKVLALPYPCNYLCILRRAGGCAGARRADAGGGGGEG